MDHQSIYLKHKILIDQNMKTALIPLVKNLGLNKTDFILNMFNHYESIAEANKTLNMNMNGSTTCLIY